MLMLLKKNHARIWRNQVSNSKRGLITIDAVVHSVLTLDVVAAEYNAHTFVEAYRSPEEAEDPDVGEEGAATEAVVDPSDESIPVAEEEIEEDETPVQEDEQPIDVHETDPEADYDDLLLADAAAESNDDDLAEAEVAAEDEDGDSEVPATEEDDEAVEITNANAPVTIENEMSAADEVIPHQPEDDLFDELFDEVFDGVEETAPVPANTLPLEIGGEETIIHDQWDHEEQPADVQSHDGTDGTSMNMTISTGVVTSIGNEGDAKPTTRIMDTHTQHQSKADRFSDQPKSTTFALAQSRASSSSQQPPKLTGDNRSKSGSKSSSRGRSVHDQLYELSSVQQEEGKTRRNSIEMSLQFRAAERNGKFTTGKTESDHLRMRHEANRENLKEEFVKPEPKITLAQAGLLYERLMLHKNRIEEKRVQMRKDRDAREMEWIVSMSQRKISLDQVNRLYYRGTTATSRSRSRGGGIPDNTES